VSDEYPDGNEDYMLSPAKDGREWLVILVDIRREVWVRVVLVRIRIRCTAIADRGGEECAIDAEHAEESYERLQRRLSFGGADGEVTAS